MKADKLRFAVFGCGFWARYQIPAWMEFQEEVELVALCSRNLDEASELAQQYRVPYCYDDADQLLEQHGGQLDFVDIITDVHTHPLFTFKAAEKGLHVITQKPMAADLRTAMQMLDCCERKGLKFFVHENFRWQAPIRRLKELLQGKTIGRPFKCRLSFLTSFPVFKNQPALRELEDLILADLGSHTFDIARFLFGEVSQLYCQTQSISPGIRGEDVANTLLTHVNGVQCFVEMSFATKHPDDSFPQVQVFIEGESGSIRLEKNFQIRISTHDIVKDERVPPVAYAWANPDYLVVHSSIVHCNRNILDDLQGKGHAETTGKDNLETLRLVYAAYESARSNKVVFLKDYP